MVVYVATGSSLNTLNKLLSYWAKDLRGKIRPMSYEEFLLAERLPQATYILSDHERLTRPQRAMAVSRWNALSRSCRMLNHPDNVKLRYDLLSGLHEQGVNRFRIFRLDELPSDLRYPVFLRLVNDHEGSRTNLLSTHEEVQRELTRLIAAGIPLEEVLVTESIATPVANGLYRKFAAFRIGEEIIPRHVVYSRNWVVKVPGVWNAQRREEERAYLAENPHRSKLLEIFNDAEIEYGRIDYDVIDGAIQVWEINTNPTVMSSRKEVPLARRSSQFEFARRYADAIQAISSGSSGLLNMPEQHAFAI